MTTDKSQTTNLPFRLRRGVALDGGGHNYTKIGLMDEAADEIERLQSALGKIARRHPADTAENMVRFARDTIGEGWRDA